MSIHSASTPLDRDQLRLPWLVIACMAIGSIGCEKEKQAEPTESPTAIASMCIGLWRADSSLVPTSGLYNHHAAATFQFSMDGHLHIAWPDSSGNDFDFAIGEDVLNTSQGESGRSLIWATQTGVPFDSGLGILMIFQNEAECFLLLSDDIGPNAAPNSPSTINEFTMVDGDPVFDFWAKCYRQ